MTRICLGRPTLVNKKSKSDQDLDSLYKISLYNSNHLLVAMALHLNYSAA